MRLRPIFFAAAIALVVAAFPGFVTAAAPTTARAVHVNHAALLSQKWQLLAGTDSFANLTAFEMIDLLHGMTIHHLELSAQPLSPEHRDVMVGPDMPDAMRAALLAKIKSHKMDVVSWAQGGTARQTAFVFAHQLGVKNLIVHYRLGDAEDRLANQFSINVLSDHADFNASGLILSPDSMFGELKHLSPRCGVVVPVGNWGHDPMAPPDAQATIEKLGRRVVEIHFGASTSTDLVICQQLKATHFVGQMEVSPHPLSWRFPTTQPAEQLGAFVRSLDAFTDAVTQATGIAEK